MRVHVVGLALVMLQVDAAPSRESLEMREALSSAVETMKASSGWVLLLLLSSFLDFKSSQS